MVDFNGEETVFVMVTRRPLPAKIFYRPVGEAKETQQKALALAMRRFASSPVVLEVPWHGLVFGTGQEESSERLFDIVYFRKWDFSVPTIHTLFKVRVQRASGARWCIALGAHLCTSGAFCNYHDCTGRYR